MAKERTVLAYVRTSLAAMAAGLGVVKFFPEHPMAVLLGWVVVAGGMLGLIFGIFRGRRVSKAIREKLP